MIAVDAEQRAWELLCQRLQRDPATSEESDTCTLRAAWKAMLAFAHSDPRPVAEGLRGAALKARGWFGPVTSDEMRVALADLDTALATHSPAPMAGEGQEAVSDAVHAELWKADAEVTRLRTALVMIAETQRERFAFAAAHSEWCQRTARTALAAHPSTQEGGK